jgi:hypothetical protein
MTQPMRMILLAPFAAWASIAHAGSIDRLQSGGTEPSIDHVTCPQCAPLKSRVREEVPDVVLAPGTQKIEFRKVGGVLKVFRTEAWMGGSPVTYVSKASTDLIDQKTADALSKEAAPDVVAIDGATTSAVNADLSDTAPMVKPDRARPEDGKPMEPIRIRVERSAVPQSADMSDGASATVDRPAKPHPFDAGKMQMRLGK